MFSYGLNTNYSMNYPFYNQYQNYGWNNSMYNFMPMNFNTNLSTTTNPWDSINSWQNSSNSFNWNMPSVNSNTQTVTNNLTTSTSNPSFQANGESGNTNGKEETKGLSTGTKWAIGLGAAALIIGGGIWIFMSRGKSKPHVPFGGNNNPVPEVKEIGLASFKEAGNKFEKGKAILADGTKYTGNITTTSKDGSNLVMEYIDGVLQKSTKTKGAETIFEKTYKYSDELGLEQVIKKNNTVLKKYIDNAGNLNIKTPKHHTIIDKPTGLISINGKFIDKPKNITGTFRAPYCHVSQAGNEMNYPFKVKGTEIPIDALDPLSSGKADFPKGEANLCWFYQGQQNNNRFNVDNIYHFNSSGRQSSKMIDLYGKYGEYRNLNYDFKSGTVTNGDTPLFNFNYRTNEITDLKIDKKEAEELVNFAKEQYNFYQKAQKARLREYRAG